MQTEVEKLEDHIDQLKEWLFQQLDVGDLMHPETLALRKEIHRLQAKLEVMYAQGEEVLQAC